MKRGWVSMFCVLVAIGVDLSSVILGAELANSMPIDQAILSVVVGSFCSAVLYTICSLVGSSTSLSTSMITKQVFGELGSKIFSVVIGISLLGWFGVQVGFFSQNSEILLSHFNIMIDPKIISLVGGLLMMSTVIYGYKSMEKLSVYSVPFLLILMFFTIYLAFSKNGMPAIDHDMKATMTFAQGVSLSVSIIIVGAIISPDISRWAIDAKNCALSSFWGILFGNSFMIIVSIILVKCMGTSEIMNIFITLGKVPQNVLTIVLGIIATLLAVFGIYERFTDFLNLLGIIIAPVGGVYTAEYYIIKKEFKEFTENRVITTKPVVIRSIIAWVIGIAVTALSTYGFMHLTSIASLDGFLVGFVAQVILGKILK